MAFATLVETKQHLNLDSGFTAADTKITTSMNSADNYIDTQTQLHATLPITPVPAELITLASQLAAAQYNYWQSPEKTDLLKSVAYWEKRIQDFILANFGKKNPTKLSGGKTFGSTAGITGRT